MCILLFGGAVLVPFLRDGGHALHPVYMGLSAVLAVGAVLYAGIFESKTAEGFLFWLIPLVYKISVAFLLLFDRPFTFPFWTFGGLLILCAFQLRFGMFINLFLLFVIGSLQPNWISEVLVVQLLCLLLFGFVIPYAKSWKDAVNVLVSVAAILVSVRIVCFFTMDKQSLTNDIFSVAVVYTIVIGAVLLLSKVLRETLLQQEQAESFDFLEELAAGAEEQDANVSEYIALTEGHADAEVPVVLRADSADVFGESDSENAAQSRFYEKAPEIATEKKASVEEERLLTEQLETLAEDSAPLLVQFAQKYPKAFLHSGRVALIAAEVATRLEGVNASLVKCGGYYHEIGRLYGEKTLENTLAVARDEAFPERLQAVLREHVVGGDKPTSKEAALVMLTDNICGMCEHLKKTQKGRILVAKVIDRALNLRLAKGDLSQSGLTAQDLSVILNSMSEVIKEDMF